MDHKWPLASEHLWGPWQWARGLPKPLRYRKCVHPKCEAIQEEEGPKA